MRVEHFLAAGLSGLLLVSPQAGAGQELTGIDNAWSRYANARFGTMADVPTNLFTIVDPPPANDDGRQFKAKDGAELTVSGSYGSSTVTENFAEYKAWILEQLRQEGVQITYNAQNKDWLVASGIKGDDIVYVKVVEGCDATHEMRITYPTARKSTYDPVIGRIARSLRCMKPE